MAGVPVGGGGNVLELRKDGHTHGECTKCWGLSPLKWSAVCFITISSFSRRQVGEDGIYTLSSSLRRPEWGQRQEAPGWVVPSRSLRTEELVATPPVPTTGPPLGRAAGLRGHSTLRTPQATQGLTSLKQLRSQEPALGSGHGQSQPWHRRTGFGASSAPPHPHYKANSMAIRDQSQTTAVPVLCGPGDTVSARRQGCREAPARCLTLTPPQGTMLGKLRHVC